MKRHSRQATRAALQRHRTRRLRLWTDRYNVPAETAIRFLRDRKHCSCTMCKRGLPVRYRRDAERDKEDDRA